MANHSMRLTIQLICEQNRRETHGSLRVQEEVVRRLRNVSIIRTDYRQSGNNIRNKIYTSLIFPIAIFIHSMDSSINHFFHQNFAYIIPLLPVRNPIITCYDLISLKDENASPFQRIFNQLCLRGLKKAKKIITGSMFSKSDMVRSLGIDPSRVVVAPFGCDAEAYRQLKGGGADKYGLRNRNRVILYVGSEQRRKNVDKILKAISVVRKTYPDVLFVKVGRPDESGARKELLNLVSALQISENVRFIDYVEEEDLPSVYRLSNVFVFLSSDEGFGLPVLEAMACGCPTITTRKSSLPEIGGDAALYVDPEDTEEVAEIIIRILDDERLSDTLTAKGLLQAKRFRWEDTVKSIERVYQQIAETSVN